MSAQPAVACDALNTRLYICGFPKSGLHAVNLMVAAFLRPEIGYDENWFGTFSKNAWTTEWVNGSLIERVAKSVRPGYYIRGHMGFSPYIAQVFYSYGVAIVFVYRDLRDVVVSQAHHVLSDDDARFKHPGKALYKALPSFEDVLVACIEGIGEFAGLFERWALYAGWLDVDWVHKMRFEDIITYPRQTARDLLTYAIEHQTGDWEPWPTWFRWRVEQQIIKNRRQTRRSATFRKGKTGGWREVFTPRVKECFKAHDTEDWLVKLGYEKDRSW